MRAFAKKKCQVQGRTVFNSSKSSMETPTADRNMNPILHLQQTAGNQAVQRLLQGRMGSTGSGLGFARQSHRVNHRTPYGAELPIQRDLVTEPPESPAVQVDLTDEQIQQAIGYNRRRYNAAQTRVIQDVVGAPVTGIWDRQTIEAVAALQEEYGMVKDGKVGPDTIGFINQELRAEGERTVVALGYRTVTPRTDLGCGGYRWAIRWNLMGADRRTNGFVVQKVIFNHRRRRCGGGTNNFAKTYWEAWQVRRGRIYIGTSDDRHNADTFETPPTPNQRGTTYEEGRAKFIPRYRAPLSWGRVAEARSLPATESEPDGWSDAGTRRRWVSVRFNCCAGRSETELTGRG